MKSRCVVPLGGGGGAGAWTPNDDVVLCPSGLATVTLRDPVVADAAIAMLAISCDAELNVQALTVMPVPKLHVAPLWKFVPEIVTLRFCPCNPLFGVIPLIAGGLAGGVTAFTVKIFV